MGIGSFNGLEPDKPLHDQWWLWLNDECMHDQGWCAVWLKSALSPKLNMNKEELSQT